MGTVTCLETERVLRHGWVDNHDRLWVLAGELNEQDLERYERDLIEFGRNFGEHCTRTKERNGRHYLWRLKHIIDQPHVQLLG